MLTKEQLRAHVQEELPNIIQRMNVALTGVEVDELEPVLSRIGNGRRLPHWYAGLLQRGEIPNKDGKSSGSVLEMLFVAVLETYTFQSKEIPPLKINPARGVDLPDLDLSIKSPSENYCTSEPFSFAYERLLGSSHDVLVLITDYQKKKKLDPLSLQIVDRKYLTKSQLADKTLCAMAKELRQSLTCDEPSHDRHILQFLAYINQLDWKASRILRLIKNIRDDKEIERTILGFEREFEKENKKRLKEDRIPLLDADLIALQRILEKRPLRDGIRYAADDWVLETQREAARLPSEDEWARFLTSPLDGQITMSPALQWRYNFECLFVEPKQRKSAKNKSQAESV